MKKLLLCGLALSLSAFAQDSDYAPNDGSAKPGNPGTFTSPKGGMGDAAPTSTGTGTDIRGSGSLGTGSSNPNSGSTMNTGDVVGSNAGTNIPAGNADPNVEANENLERSNTSANPIPEDTTLQGSTQTGPYKTGKNKQSQEATDEELDYRTIPKVDHMDLDDSENQ